MRAALAFSPLFVALLAGCASPPPPAPAAPDVPAPPPAVAVATAAATASADATAPPPAPSPADPTPSANGFALRLFRRTLSKPGNTMLAPTSVREALALVALGARGDTAREMTTALDLPDDVRRIFREPSAPKRDKHDLVVASRLWVDKAFPLAPDFATVGKELSSDPPGTVDFAHADDARRTINTWVAEKTKDKIRELLPKGSVGAGSRLVVTSAVYFKASWLLPFAPGATKEDAFHLDDGRTARAPLMHATDSYRFAQASGAKVLELRYQDTDLSMLVVLPDDPRALPKLEESLSDELVRTWADSLASQRVAVTLPRFTFRSGGSMVPALRELGMKTAFTDSADFTGISQPQAQGHLTLGEVAHQTFVAVDEKGTEAAAATGVVMRTTSLVTGPVAEFKADHPFLFFLRDPKRGLVVFAGRVADPTAKGN